MSLNISFSLAKFSTLLFPLSISFSSIYAYAQETIIAIDSSSVETSDFFNQTKLILSDYPTFYVFAKDQSHINSDVLYQLNVLNSEISPYA